MGPAAACGILSPSTGFGGPKQSLGHYAKRGGGPLQAGVRAIPRPGPLFSLRHGRIGPGIARFAELLSTSRLPEKHELHRGMERAAARGARRLGLSSAYHREPHPGGSQTSIPLAVSPADGASFPHPPGGHHALFGSVFLRFTLRAGQAYPWHALPADRTWGLSAGTVP